MKNKFIIVKKLLAASLVVLMVLFISGCGEEISQYPSATKEFFVNDFADLIDPEDEQKIYTQGVELQEKTKAQAVVITIDSLDEKPIQEYALEIGREWGVGDAEKDNGVVILLSKNDREIYIAVGDGLEGALPDSKTGRIIDNYAAPYLSSNDFSQALASVYNSIVNETYIEYGIEVPEDYAPMAILPQTQTETQTEAGKVAISWLVLLILVAVYLLIFGRRGLFVFGAPRFFGGYHHHGGFGGGSSGGFGGFSGGGGTFSGGGAGRKF